ncbi:hypothetical protein Ahy_B01g057151 [Arachis hypogaea]|uniref:Uncharacterized protein n=1 Tax=Arachis hypogaea TaxID=3818 RepID=A0A445B0D5_ARAHY|nr:hypothetical protein Ahy_B01g057151 [Arachis hypogaea]
MVPLLTASFVWAYKLRLGLILGWISFPLILFGYVAATLDKALPFKSCVRTFFGRKSRCFSYGNPLNLVCYGSWMGSAPLLSNNSQMRKLKPML